MQQDLPAILVLAAGASARMRGADKLLETIGGVPQIARIVEAALATGAEVHVTLPALDADRHAAIAGLPANIVATPDAFRGMAASLGAGVAAIPQGRAVLVVLADMPEIDADDLRRIIAAFQNAPDMIWQATSANGKPGHPVLFPAALRADLLKLSGDVGAREVLKAHADRVQRIALPFDHATTDLDTPEDWAAWRAGRDG